MAWDKNKHKVLDTKDVTVGDDTYVVEAYSYNGGETKIAIRQKITRKKEEMIVPLKGGISIKAAKKLGRELRDMAISLSEK